MIASSRKRLDYASIPLPPRKVEQPVVVQNQSFSIPHSKEELWNLTKFLTGVHIPRVAACQHHQAPFDAFAEAFFAEVPQSVWVGSRGFGGKTTMLAALSTIEAAVLGSGVTLLGGSREQSSRVHEATGSYWDRPATSGLLHGIPTKSHTKFKNGGKMIVLTASTKSARGAHEARLRLDEVDEMALDIFDAATGQPMDQKGVKLQTVISSTHHYPDRTMTEVLKRAELHGWPVWRWCYKDTSGPDGWLSQDMIERKRSTISSLMWQSEYELQEPMPEDRAIDTDAVEAMFKGLELVYSASTLQIFEKPILGARYAIGADWGKQNHFSVFVVLRIDCSPFKVVAYQKQRRLQWPVIIGSFNEVLEIYKGKACHDATGIGGVIDDYLDDKQRVEAVIMGGQKRTDLFGDYILAVEHGKVLSPRIQSLYKAHKFVTRADLFGGGHPPDEFVAASMAWKASGAPKPIDASAYSGLMNGSSGATTKQAYSAYATPF